MNIYNFIIGLLLEIAGIFMYTSHFISNGTLNLILSFLIFIIGNIFVLEAHE
jgi:hypothetical protein